MKQNNEDDKAAILIHILASEGRVSYLYAAKITFGHWSADWEPSYRIPERTVDLRLKELMECGFILESTPKKHRKPVRSNPPPKQPKYFAVHPVGKAWVEKHLIERFKQEDFTWSQPLLITSIRCLWEAKEPIFLHKLLSTRLSALEKFLTKQQDSGERLNRTNHHVFGILMGNLRNERYYLEMLRQELESHLGPKRLQEINANEEKEKMKEN